MDEKFCQEKQENKIKDKKIRKKEAGMMTVEAVLSLVPFIMVILGIISFINIYEVHNKIQYAMYQLGSELSGYTYFYQALGLRTGDLALKNDIDTQTEPVDKAISDISNFLDQLDSLSTTVSNIGNNGAGVENVGSVYQQGQEVIQGGQAVGADIESFAQDPKSLLRGIIYLGIEAGENKGKQLLISWMGAGMMENYLDAGFLASGAMDADTYLKKYGVKGGLSGLDYSRSQLFQDSQNRMIDLVVEYDVEVYILKLFLKDPTIHVSQRAVIPAWLDGDGVTCTKE